MGFPERSRPLGTFGMCEEYGKITSMFPDSPRETPTSIDLYIHVYIYIYTCAYIHI